MPFFKKTGGLQKQFPLFNQLPEKTASDMIASEYAKRGYEVRREDMNPGYNTERSDLGFYRMGESPAFADLRKVGGSYNMEFSGGGGYQNRVENLWTKVQKDIESQLKLQQKQEERQAKAGSEANLELLSKGALLQQGIRGITAPFSQQAFDISANNWKNMGVGLAQQTAARFARGPYNDSSYNSLLKFAEGIPFAGSFFRDFEARERAKRGEAQISQVLSHYDQQYGSTARSNADISVELSQRAIQAQIGVPSYERNYLAKKAGIEGRYADVHDWIRQMNMAEQMPQYNTAERGLRAAKMKGLEELGIPMMPRIKLYGNEFSVARAERQAELLRGAMGMAGTTAGLGEGATSFSPFGFGVGTMDKTDTANLEELKKLTGLMQRLADAFEQMNRGSVGSYK
jgi:hypothetical protein